MFFQDVGVVPSPPSVGFMSSLKLCGVWLVLTATVGYNH